MGAVATSFETRTAAPERVAGALQVALAQVRSPAGGLVFVSGKLTESVEAVAQAISDAGCPVPVALAAGAAVMTERGELEGQSAATGVVWAGGRTELVPLPGTGDEAGESLALALSDRTGKTAPTVFAFVRPEGFGPSSLAPLRDLRGTRHVVGAGTVGAPGSAGVLPGGNVLTGSVALIVRGLSAPAIGVSHSCRLLSPLQTITSCRGALLSGIDGEPALAVLAAHGERVPDRSLLLVVLSDNDPRETTGRPPVLVRGIQGIDPDRQAIVVSDEIREGMRMAFAVRDPRAARDDFEAMTRELERGVAGAAPRFGVLIDCAGRGSGLYGAHDVDSKLLRARFPGMPFAGLASSFEIAPHAGKPTLQLYTGVATVFASPS